MTIEGSEAGESIDLAEHDGSVTIVLTHTEADVKMYHKFTAAAKSAAPAKEDADYEGYVEHPAEGVTITEPGTLMYYAEKNGVKSTPKSLTVTNSNTTGIADIEAAGEAVEYFNLQGVRVANPRNGLYIRRQGSKVEKIIVK